MLQVKEAVAKAQQYLPEVFEGAAGKQLTLEGVELTDNDVNWIVTFSYGPSFDRDYKTVKLRTENGGFRGSTERPSFNRLAVSSQSRILLLDTNLVLLWLVANTDPTLVLSYKRVSMFTYEDVKLLRLVVREFAQFKTTPHILTEVSNFLSQAPEQRQKVLREAFRRYAESMDETFEPAGALLVREQVPALGLTDLAILSLAADAMVLTTDYRLTGHIRKLGGQATHFLDLQKQRNGRRPDA